MESKIEFSSSSAAADEVLLQALIARGWCFKDTGRIKALIAEQSSLLENRCTVDLVESELTNMDLRSIGGKSLPEPSVLRKASHLQGPKVLQISSVRDISQSQMAESSGNSNSLRLLRLKVTDGHNEITCIEYTHVVQISDDIIPGTKVCLENKAVVHSGIVCLSSNVITVLGGIVEPLFEEWQMNKKYSALSTRQSNDKTAAGGPPPFEKLQVGASRQFSHSSGSTSNSTRTENLPSRQRHELHTLDLAKDNAVEDAKLLAHDVINNDKPTSSEARQKEAAEAIPVQNQAAAQKLLQKMTQPKREHYFKGQRHRGRGKQEDSTLLTLEEWEKGKYAAMHSKINIAPDVSQDEYLARQLQEQFDLEDAPVQKGHSMTEADSIKMSMFNFEIEDGRAQSTTNFRGRGRGRGRRGSRRGRA